MTSLARQIEVHAATRRAILLMSICVVTQGLF
jgi:hypothetical protein